MEVTFVSSISVKHSKLGVFANKQFYVWPEGDGRTASATLQRQTEVLQAQIFFSAHPLRVCCPHGTASKDTTHLCLSYSTVKCHISA